MRLQTSCTISFDVTGDTAFTLMLRPRSGFGQWIVREEYNITPAMQVVEYTDHFGNLCQRLIAPPGPLNISTAVLADVPDYIDVAPGAPFTPAPQLPDYTLQFLLPSRYAQSDLLGDLAQDIIAGAQPGYDQAEAIRAWIHDNIRYQYGVSDSSTSAVDTAKQRSGVCRDYVHLGMALCRSINIPARMVVGYLYQLDPMDQHAWFEAFVGGRWYTFDATQSAPRGGRITIAFGRDAADVALTTQFGPAVFKHLQVQVDRADA